DPSVRMIVVDREPHPELQGRVAVPVAEIPPNDAPARALVRLRPEPALRMPEAVAHDVGNAARPLHRRDGANADARRGFDHGLQHLAAARGHWFADED